MSSKNKNAKDVHIDFPEEKQDENAENQEEKAGEALSEKNNEQHQHKSTEKEEINQLDEKNREMQEQFLRLRAEFANYKKRVDKERLEFSDYIKVEMIKKFLPVLDDFKNMLEKVDDTSDVQMVYDGAKMIYDKFYQIMRNEGLVEIESLGAEFDPLIHEAMLMQPVETENDHNKIINVFQEGFKLNNRLIRPSRVVVGKYEGEQKKEIVKEDKN